MATFSETSFLQLYKDALTNPENVEELITLLQSPRTLFNDTLLANLGVTTEKEWREIDESSRGGRLAGRNERRAKNLIGKVISKNNLKAYRGLRKFIAKQAPNQMEIIEKVFPFGAEEDKAGLTPQIVQRDAQQPAVTPHLSTTPTILWIMQTQAEFGDAKKSLIQEKFVHGTEKVPSQYNLFLEKLAIPLPEWSLYDEATLFLAHPKVELSGPDPFRQILSNFTPRPHFALLTGPCHPLPGSEINPDSTNDTVHAVVVTSRTPLPIEGEVQYSTELLKLKGKIEKLCVSFGGAVKTMDQYEGCSVYFPKAKLFYAAAQQIEGLEYLAIAQVCKDPDRSVLAESYYRYVCNILKCIANELS